MAQEQQHLHSGDGLKNFVDTPTHTRYFMEGGEIEFFESPESCTIVIKPGDDSTLASFQADQNQYKVVKAYLDGLSDLQLAKFNFESVMTIFSHLKLIQHTPREKLLSNDIRLEIREGGKAGWYLLITFNSKRSNEKIFPKSLGWNGVSADKARDLIEEMSLMEMHTILNRRKARKVLN